MIDAMKIHTIYRDGRPIPHVLRRHGLPLLLLLLLVTTKAGAQPGPVIRAMLDDAAARFAIPAPVLYGIAYNESRWRHVPVDSLAPSCSGMPPAIGIMGLRDDDYFGHSLRAGTSLGISPGDAAASIEKNILVGAAYLSSLFTGTDRSVIGEWMSAIAAYPGIPADQEGLRLLYVDGVVQLLRRGWLVGGAYVAAMNIEPVDRARLDAGLRELGMSIAGGDYPGAGWDPSPNYSSRNGTPITAVTIHDTEGGFAGSLSWLKSPQAEASAHYIVRSVDGLIVQMVRESDKAWHVRTENPYTIGIEHEGYTTRPEYFTPAMYAASAALVRHLIGRYDIPLDRTHVKGHLDFPNNTHTDPGGWWDWPAYYRLISGATDGRVIIDPFEDDVVGWWQPQLSGSTSGIDISRTRFSIGPGGAFSGNGGGELDYAFSTADGGLARVFRSGHGNTNDGLLNIGSSGTLSLAVRGDGSGNALELWFYDAGKGNRIIPATAITWSGWRTITVPLASLGGGGPFRFHSIVLRQTTGAPRTGRIAFDDLAHEARASSVSEEVEREGITVRKFIIDGAQPLPGIIRDGRDISIYSLVGERLHSFDTPPEAAVGSYLRPGTYIVVSSGISYMIGMR